MTRGVWHGALSWCSLSVVLLLAGVLTDLCSIPSSQWSLEARTRLEQFLQCRRKRSTRLSHFISIDALFFALDEFGLFQWELRIFFSGPQPYTQDSSQVKRLLKNPQYEFARSFNSYNINKRNLLSYCDKRHMHFQWASHSDSCSVVQLHLGDQSLWAFSTHSHTHSWRWALLQKPPIVQLPKKFPAFYGTRRFITVFTRALHWSLS
jgi:hypothetical protein